MNYDDKNKILREYLTDHNLKVVNLKFLKFDLNINKFIEFIETEEIDYENIDAVSVVEQ